MQYVFMHMQLLATALMHLNCTYTGLEKYLNSTLPFGQVTLKFCLPGGLLRLPNFSNSLIIHESMNGRQTTAVF